MQAVQLFLQRILLRHPVPCSHKVQQRGTRVLLPIVRRKYLPKVQEFISRWKQQVSPKLLQHRPLTLRRHPKRR